MESNIREQLTSALAAFDIGRVHDVSLVEQGLIHDTFVITSDKGVFNFQRLHPKLALPEIMRDMDAVNRQVRGATIEVPMLVRTESGNLCVRLQDRMWRLTTHVPGDTFDEPPDRPMVASAARVLGKFHDALSDLDYTFQSPHPLHQTEAVLQKLRNRLEPRAQLEDLASAYDVGRRIEDALSKELLAPGLRRWVVHGDPKFSNVVFRTSDDGDQQAMGMIDLDTVCRHTRLVDLGDAARSWCRKGREDEPTPFLLERFRALCEGYLTAAPALDDGERAALCRAPRTITLELAARFVTDVFDDSYFAWDADRYESRRKHNLERGRSCLALYESMRKQTDAMRVVIDAHAE